MQGVETAGGGGGFVRAVWARGSENRRGPTPPQGLSTVVLLGFLPVLCWRLMRGFV